MLKRLIPIAVFCAGAAAAATCSTEALNALQVPRMRIESAAAVPGYCRVRGTVTTSGEGAPDGSARFEVRLPENWNGKFLFYGVGGLAGSIPSNPDAFNAVGLGYAIAVTDTGHEAGGTDAQWSIAAGGRPDEAKIADYYFRAAHDVTVSAKELVRKHYAGDIRVAYFAGCSNGGRMALMEAQRFPDDYDGIIAGAPFMSVHAMMTPLRVMKGLTEAGYIPPKLWPVIDEAMNASCDAADGVKDGLIQNPAKCSFDPASLICKSGASERCLTSEQAAALKGYMEAVRDRRGRLVQPGLSITDGDGRGGMIAWNTGAAAPDFRNPERWTANAPAGWLFADHITQYLVERNPQYHALDFDIGADGVIGDAALKLFDERTGAADADDPSRVLPFIRKGKKLLMYHGYSDPALTPYRSVLYYEKLAGLTKGYDALQKNVRLFMVPGMQHCGGGPGPNAFDTLAPLDQWVANGRAPEQIEATKFVNDQRSAGVERRMPLCKFPEMARYKGTGDVKDAANWSCAEEPSLTEVGPNGLAAGLGKR